MSSSQNFMPGRVPGNSKHLKRLIDYNSKIAFYNLESKFVGGNPDYFCECFKDKVNRMKQGYNDPMQTNSERVAQLTTNTLGGKTTFGNFNVPAKITYLGGIEGQPGGIPRPLRNTF
jgi:hypothetical protein